MTEDPATDPRTRDLGCWLCSVEKGVVSMKAEPGRDILVLIQSSATLIQSMLAAGLVDDLRLAVVAVLLGGGAAQAAGRRVGRLGPGVVDDPAWRRAGRALPAAPGHRNRALLEASGTPFGDAVHKSSH